MTDYAAEIRRHRRIAILRFLKDSPEYTSNASLLTDVLRGVGVTSTFDQVVTEFVWLQEQGFVSFDPKASLPVVTVTRRGVEIADGIATHPDIQRPSARR